MPGNEDSFYSSDSFQSGVLASSFNNTEVNVGLSKKPRINDEVTLALEVFPNGESKQRDMEVIYRGGRRGRRGRPPTSNADDKRRQKLYEVRFYNLLKMLYNYSAAGLSIYFFSHIYSQLYCANVTDFSDLSIHIFISLIDCMKNTFDYFAHI